nr:immunoglobulin light chain junction region [Macaca mulatta]MOX78486.1 immunoglobulin light chain junction region [Macaca mulatta]MOX78747.1 immunoglobulin light chain junction region [Macaca mulatta]MOX79487.1 immunoglobulin light chain junction region [Macaca mulatta]MOX79639.1 immunoglobulin light chain junction region [Macaca mulatta]
DYYCQSYDNTLYPHALF